ncbi:MAG TPA: methylenetetrahydrofolate reductase [Gammaproteobacteria bacterium]|nr:methylenetetrahydrofolate reductase [Gammaproteobacteria bacterium]
MSVADRTARDHESARPADPGDPLPRLPGHVSRGRFERVLRAGHFAVTAEIAPPDSADPVEVAERVQLFDGVVDAVNATDGSGANCHMSSVAVCALLTRMGYSPIFQISCRDRNRIAIQGDILGAAAMGICSILSLSGDDVSVGDHPQAMPVFDLDSISLLETVRVMCNESRFLSGRKLTQAPALFPGSTINPFVPPYPQRVRQLRKKIEAGALFIQTQYCFDLERMRDFMRQVVDQGLAERCYILPGVGPLPSARTARWMRSNVPGVHIPDAVIARLEGSSNQREAGRQFCVEMIHALKELPGVSGVHVMAYRQEKHVAEMVRKSGVLGQRVPWYPQADAVEIAADFHTPDTPDTQPTAAQSI